MKRPDKNRFGEFRAWVKEVITETLDHEEMVDAYDKREAVHQKRKGSARKAKTRTDRR